MGQDTPSVEPSILNSPPAVYHEWYKSQPRTRQCAESIERLCMFLSGAAVRVSQIVRAIVRGDEPRPCAIPDALLDAAIEFAQHAKDDAEQLIVRVRGVWAELPSAVSFDPRGWETDLLMRLEQARLDAGCVALTLSTRKGGWPVSVDEAREWKTVLWNHTGPLMERHRALKSIPAPASPGEASPNTDHGVANAIERAAELGAERAAEKVALVLAGDKVRVAKLPELKPHDRQAWQLATLHGMTQAKMAAALNKEHGTTYTQGQVSRMIARAKAHAEANGLAEKVAGPIDRPRTVDPGRLELGPRVDKRKPRQSDMARANDDDE